MNSSEVTAVEKALLLLTLGFLEALRCGAIDDDEAFYTIGIPKIFGPMKTYGISSRVADLVSQLDEFGALKSLGGEEAWGESIQATMDECKIVLATMPPDPTRPEPILRLFRPVEQSSV